MLCWDLPNGLCAMGFAECGFWQSEVLWIILYIRLFIPVEQCQREHQDLVSHPFVLSSDLSGLIKLPSSEILFLSMKVNPGEPTKNDNCSGWARVLGRVCIGMSMDLLFFCLTPPQTLSRMALCKETGHLFIHSLLSMCVCSDPTPHARPWEQKGKIDRILRLVKFIF